MYYDKWWKSQGRESEETACLSSKSSSQETVANALGVVNIGGIFVVLLCGLAFAVLVAIAEFCWKTSMKSGGRDGGYGTDIMNVSTQLRTASASDSIRRTSPHKRHSRVKGSRLKSRR